MSGINLMPLTLLARWLEFMFEAICLPQAWKAAGLYVGSHIIHKSFSRGTMLILCFYLGADSIQLYRKWTCSIFSLFRLPPGFLPVSGLTER